MDGDAIDLDRLRAAHAPWVFVAGGRRYESTPVSVEQVVRFDAETRGASQSAQLAARRRLLRLAFPWRPSFIWRGDPVRLILSASPAVHAEVWSSFWLSLRSLSEGSATRATSHSSSFSRRSREAQAPSVA